MAQGDFNISFKSNINTFGSELNQKIAAAKGDIAGLVSVVEELDNRLAGKKSSSGSASNIQGLIADLTRGLDLAAKSFSAEFGKASGTFSDASAQIQKTVTGLEGVTTRLDLAVAQMRLVKPDGGGKADTAIKALDDKDNAVAQASKTQLSRITDASKKVDRLATLSDTLAKRATAAGDGVKNVNAQLGNLNRTLGRMKFPEIEVPETITLSGVRFLAANGSVISGDFGAAAGSGEGDPARVQRVAEQAASTAGDAVATVSKEVGKISAQPGKAVDPVRQEFLSQMRGIVRDTAVTADRDILDKSFDSGTAGRTNYTVSDLELSGAPSAGLVESSKELEAAQKQAAAKARLVADAEERLARAKQGLQIAQETGASGRSLGGYAGAVTKVVNELEVLRQDAKKAQNVLKTAQDIDANRLAQTTSDRTIIPRGTNYGDSAQRSYGSIISPGGLTPDRIEAAFAAVGVANATRREESLSATAGFLDQRPLATLAEFKSPQGASEIERAAAQAARASLRVLDEALIEQLQFKANEGRPLSSQETQALQGAQRREEERQRAISGGVARSDVRLSLLGEGALPGQSKIANRVYRDPSNIDPSEIPGYAAADAEGKAALTKKLQELKRSMQRAVNDTYKAIVGGLDSDSALEQGQAKVRKAYEGVFGKVQQVGTDFQGRYTPAVASDTVYSGLAPRDLLRKQASLEGLAPLREKLTGLGGTLPEGLGTQDELKKLIGEILKLEAAARKAAGVLGRQSVQPQIDKKEAEASLRSAKSIGGLGLAADRARQALKDDLPPGADPVTGYAIPSAPGYDRENALRRQASLDAIKAIPEGELAAKEVGDKLGIAAADLPKDLQKLDAVVKQYIRMLEGGSTVAQAKAYATSPEGRATARYPGVTVEQTPSNVVQPNGKTLAQSSAEARENYKADTGVDDPTTEAKRLLLRINNKVVGFLDYIEKTLPDGTKVAATSQAYVAKDSRGQGAYQAAQSYLSQQYAVIDHGGLTEAGSGALTKFLSDQPEDVQRRNIRDPDTVDPQTGADAENEKLVQSLRAQVEEAGKQAEQKEKRDQKKSQNRIKDLKAADAEVKRLKKAIAAGEDTDGQLDAALAQLQKDIAQARAAKGPGKGSGGGGSTGGSGLGTSSSKGGSVDVRVVDFNATAIGKLRSLGLGSGSRGTDDAELERTSQAGAVDSALQRQNRLEGYAEAARLRGVDPQTIRDAGAAKDYAQLGEIAAKLSAQGIERRSAQQVVTGLSGISSPIIQGEQFAAEQRLGKLPKGLEEEAQRAAAGMLKETVDLFASLRRQIQAGEVDPRAAVSQASQAAYRDPSLAGASNRSQKAVIADALGVGAGNSPLVQEAYKTGQRAAKAAQAGAVSAGQGGRGQVAQALGFRNAEGESTFSNRVGGAAGNFFVRDIAAGAYFGIANNIQEAVRAGLEAETTFIRVKDALEATNRSADGVRVALQKTSVSTGAGLDQVYEVAAQLAGVFDSVRDVEVATNLLFQMQLISGGALNTQEGFRALSSVTSAYGLVGTESLTQVADASTYLQNTIGVNIEDTLEGAARLAPLAEQIGLSFEEVATLAGEAGKKTGQTGQVASEQLGRILSRFQDSGNQQSLIELGVATDYDFATGNTGEVIKNLLAQWEDFAPQVQDRLSRAFGGSREAATFQALFSDPTELLEVMEGTLDSTGAAADRTKEIMKQLGTQLKLVGTNFANLAQLMIQTGFADALGLAVVVLNQILKLVNEVGGQLNEWLDATPVTAFFKRVLAGLVGLGIAIKLIRPAIRSVFETVGVDGGPGAPPVQAPVAPVPGAPGAPRPPVLPIAPSSPFVGQDGRPLPTGPSSRLPTAPAPAPGGFGQSVINRLGRGISSVGGELDGTANKLGQSTSRLNRGAGAAIGSVSKLGGVLQRTGTGTDQLSRSLGALTTSMFLVGLAIYAIKSAIDSYNKDTQDILSSDSSYQAYKEEQEKEKAEEEKAAGADAAREEQSDFTYFFTDALGAGFQSVLKNLNGDFGAGLPSFDSSGLNFNPFDNFGLEDGEGIGNRLNTNVYGNAYATELPEEVQKRLDEERMQVEYAFRDLDVDFQAERPGSESSNKQIKRFKEDQESIIKTSDELLAEAEEQKNRELQGLEEGAGNEVQIREIEEQYQATVDRINRTRDQALANMNRIDEVNLLSSEAIEDLDEWESFTSSLNSDSQERFDKILDEMLAGVDSLNQDREVIGGAITDAQNIKNSINQRAGVGISPKGGKQVTTNKPSKLGDYVSDATQNAANRIDQELGEREKLESALDQATLKRENILGLLEAAGPDGIALNNTDFPDPADKKAEFERLEQKAKDLLLAEQEARQALTELASSRLDLAAFFLGAGETERAAAFAQRSLNVLQAQIADWEGSKTDAVYIDMLEKEQAAKQAIVDASFAQGDLTLALESARTQDPTEQARLAERTAVRALNKAKAAGKTGVSLQAEREAVIRARQAYANALLQEALDVAAAEASTIQDPVARANADLANAYEAAALAANKGAAAKARAAADVELKEQALAAARAAEVQAAIGLRQSIATAAGRDVKASQIALNAAEKALEVARATGNQTEILNARAAKVAAEAAVRDTQLSSALDTIDFRAEMGRITAAQEIKALQRLLKERDLTRQQRRDLLLKIKGLKDELNSDLTSSGFNIGDIDLPTAYQVRRSLGIDPVRGGSGGGNTTNSNNTTNNHQRVEVKNEFRVMNEAQADQIARRVAKMIGDQMDRQSRSSGASPRLV